MLIEEDEESKEKNKVTLIEYIANKYSFSEIDEHLRQQCIGRIHQYNQETTKIYEEVDKD